MKTKNNKSHLIFNKIRKMHSSDYMMNVIDIIKTVIKIITRIFFGSALFLCVFLTIININSNKMSLDYFWDAFVAIVPIYCSLYIFVSLLKAMVFSLWDAPDSCFQGKASISNAQIGSCVIKGADESDIINNTLEISSVHEAGHALVAYLLGFELFLSVSYEKSFTNVFPKNILTMTPDMLRKFIKINYAGMAAEKILLGQASMGSFGSHNSDFNCANTYIENYVFMTNDNLSKYSLDPEVQQEVSKLSKKLYQETYDLLSENKAILKELSVYLKDTGECSYEEVKNIVEKYNYNISKENEADC